MGMERGWGSVGGVEAVPGVSCAWHRDPLQSQIFGVKAPGPPLHGTMPGWGPPWGRSHRGWGPQSGTCVPNRLSPTTLSTAPLLSVPTGSTLRCPQLPVLGDRWSPGAAPVTPRRRAPAGTAPHPSVPPPAVPCPTFPLSCHSPVLINCIWQVGANRYPDHHPAAGGARPRAHPSPGDSVPPRHGDSPAPSPSIAPPSVGLPTLPPKTPLTSWSSPR